MEINTYIVVRGSAYRATFAFNTLPPVLADRNDHVCSKLQTSWMAYNKKVEHVKGLTGKVGGTHGRERCQDIYLVPKNSELQAIVFPLSFVYHENRASKDFNKIREHILILF